MLPCSAEETHEQVTVSLTPTDFFLLRGQGYSTSTTAENSRSSRKFQKFPELECCRPGGGKVCALKIRVGRKGCQGWLPLSDSYLLFLPQNPQQTPAPSTWDQGPELGSPPLSPNTTVGCPKAGPSLPLSHHPTSIPDVALQREVGSPQWEQVGKGPGLRVLPSTAAPQN